LNKFLIVKVTLPITKRLTAKNINSWLDILNIKAEQMAMMQNGMMASR
jgi:hypothetical protein